jgi:hypothetical protein
MTQRGKEGTHRKKESSGRKERLGIVARLWRSVATPDMRVACGKKKGRAGRVIRPVGKESLEL